MIVSVTDSDEVNAIACVGAGVLGDSELIRIARVREPSYSHQKLLDADPYGLGVIIAPSRKRPINFCAPTLSERDGNAGIR